MSMLIVTLWWRFLNDCEDDKQKTKIMLNFLFIILHRNPYMEIVTLIIVSSNQNTLNCFHNRVSLLKPFYNHWQLAGCCNVLIWIKRSSSLHGYSPWSVCREPVAIMRRLETKMVIHHVIFFIDNACLNYCKEDKKQWRCFSGLTRFTATRFWVCHSRTVVRLLKNLVTNQALRQSRLQIKV